MRISCPHCGSRDVREYIYYGDASLDRPDADAPGALERFVSYVYERNNPAGPHRELWYHGFGCQAWLAVTRDVRNHKILDVKPVVTTLELDR